MGMNKKLIAAMLTAGGLAIAAITGPAIGQMAPFGGDKDVAYAGDLWKAMEGAKLIGANMIMTRPYEGTEPHGAILETIDTTLTVGGHTGAVVVKRNYGPAGLSIDDVANDPQKHLKAVTVMFKREAGYDKDNANWYWAKYLANGSLDKNPKGMQLAGRVAKGMDAGCIACHANAPGDDYLFVTDRIK